MLRSTLFRKRPKGVLVVLLVLIASLGAGFFVESAHADPILAQSQFANVNTTQAINPQCGGTCSSSGSIAGNTVGNCFQPTLTGTTGSFSIMLELGQAPNGIPRQGQPVISGQIFIMLPQSGFVYASNCRTSNPFSTSAITVAASDPISFCFSGGVGSCSCNNCFGLTQNFQVVTFSFTGQNQAIVAAGQTYVWLLYLTCQNSLSCVYDDQNSMAQGIDSTASYPGSGVNCRACMVADQWNTGPFLRSQHDDTTVGGRAFTVPFVLYGTSGGVNPPNSSCQGGNCGTPQSTTSTSSVNFNSSLTLFYIGNSPFNGYVINITTYMANTQYIGTVFLGLYLVNQGCVTANGPFSVQCPGILYASRNFVNPAGPAKLVFLTSVQVAAGQTFGVAVSGDHNGLSINDTNTSTVMYQTSGTLPSVIPQYQVFSASAKVALFAGLFQGSTPPTSTGSTGNNTVGDLIIGFVDWFGMGRLAGGLMVLMIFFAITTIGIGLVTFHLGRRPGGSPRPGFPPAGFLFILLFYIFIFSAPIGSGGVAILPPWVPIFVMAIFTWLFTEGVLKRGGRF